MKLSKARTLLLALGAICLLAQSALAVPACRCDEMTSRAPCHPTTPSDPASCCHSDQATAVPDGCGSGLQATCCMGQTGLATEVALLTIGSADSIEPGSPPVSAPVPQTASRVAVGAVVSVSPGPAGPGAWLLHSALLN